MRSDRSGRSAGTTEAERAKYAQSLLSISIAQQKADWNLRQKDKADFDRLATGQSTPAREYVREYVLLLNAVNLVGGRGLFLGALRDYRFDKDERAVIERVVAALQAKRVGGGRDEGAIRARMRVGVREIGRAVEYVSAKMAEGDACAKNECSVAGCFRVVNTGGFDKRTMNEASDMAAKAAKLVTEAGFQMVCYGDAYVTQKVSRDNVLAFYDRADDRMYVRAHPTKGEAALEVETIVHELGHRLHRRFMPADADVRMELVFNRWLRQYRKAGVETSFDPQVGDTFEHGGPRSRKRYKIIGISGGTVVYRPLLPNGEIDPRYLPASMTIDKLALAIGAGKRTHDPFPSDYARTKASEMFAELFRAVVHKTATEEQVEAFKEITGR